jgi:hypothetical protein
MGKELLVQEFLGAKASLLGMTFSVLFLYHLPQAATRNPWHTYPLYWDFWEIFSLEFQLLQNPQAVF